VAGFPSFEPKKRNSMQVKKKPGIFGSVDGSRDRDAASLNFKHGNRVDVTDKRGGRRTGVCLSAKKFLEKEASDS